MNTSCAFIIYRSRVKAGERLVSFSDEAKSVFLPPMPESQKVSLPEISSLCARWKEIVDRRQDEVKRSGDKGRQQKSHIDVLQSWRRKYTVRGLLLSESSPIPKRKEKIYLFILERFKPEPLNLKEICRQCNLNNREQEILRLILADCANKEIAKHLGLSINTVKGYMKLLMRKVGVHTRAGIISAVLSGKQEE